MQKAIDQSDPLNRGKLDLKSTNQNLNIELKQEETKLPAIQAVRNSTEINEQVNDPIVALSSGKDQQYERLKAQESEVKKIMKYKKRSYQDYLQMKQEYAKKFTKLGGLGPNIGSNEWQCAKQKELKRNEYANGLNKSAGHT